MPSRFIIPVFRHPKPALIVPTESHRLGDHGFSSPDIDLVALLDRHRLYSFLRTEKFSIAPLFLGYSPQFGGAVHARFPRKFSPPFVDRQVADFPRMNHQLVL